MKTNNFEFFWGGVFSNFHPSEITIDGVKYFCVEQYFMAMKAVYFGDFETHKLIMKSTDPKTSKKLGRKVKNFDSDEWMKVCQDFMYKGCFAKFTQNKDLKDKLLNTGTKILVEASPFDSIWGIKLDASDPRSQNEETWQGTNWLGKILTKIKNELKNENI